MFSVSIPRQVLLVGRGRIALGAAGTAEVLNGGVPSDVELRQAQLGDISASGRLLLSLACGPGTVRSSTNREPRAAIAIALAITLGF